MMNYREAKRLFDKEKSIIEKLENKIDKMLDLSRRSVALELFHRI